MLWEGGSFALEEWRWLVGAIVAFPVLPSVSSNGFGGGGLCCCITGGGPRRRALPSESSCDHFGVGLLAVYCTFGVVLRCLA